MGALRRGLIGLVLRESTLLSHNSGYNHATCKEYGTGICYITVAMRFYAYETRKKS